MENVLWFIINALASVGLALLLQETFKPDGLLRRYYLWLTYWWIRNYRQKDRWKRKILKPMGMCVFCNMPYMAMIVFFVFYVLNIQILSFIGLSYLALLQFQKS